MGTNLSCNLPCDPKLPLDTSFPFPPFTSVSLLHFQVHGGPRLPHIQRPLHHRGVRGLRQRDPLLDGALRFSLLTFVKLSLLIDEGLILSNTMPEFHKAIHF